MDDELNFTVVSSWNNDSVKFSFVFMIEFNETDQTNHYSPNSVSGKYKIEKNKFIKYLKEFGNQDEDWMISKHRGPYNLGAAMMLGFKDKETAINFILQNG